MQPLIRLSPSLRRDRHLRDRNRNENPFHPRDPRLQIQTMRNTDYVIQIKTKSGRTWTYRKEKNGWSQTASTGIVREITAEQLLSHLLPLAGDQPSLSVTVERTKRRQRPARNSN